MCVELLSGGVADLWNCEVMEMCGVVKLRSGGVVELCICGDVDM